MRFTLGIAVFIALAVTAPTVAHHSHGNYDMTQYTNLKGKVTEIHWINPHSWIYLEVTNEKGELRLPTGVPRLGRFKRFCTLSESVRL